MYFSNFLFIENMPTLGIYGFMHSQEFMTPQQPLPRGPTDPGARKDVCSSIGTSCPQAGAMGFGYNNCFLINSWLKGPGELKHRNKM